MRKQVQLQWIFYLTHWLDLRIHRNLIKLIFPYYFYFEISVNINLTESRELINHITKSKLDILNVLRVKGEVNEKTLEKLIEPSCNY